MLFLTSDLSTRCCFCRAQEERCAALAAETNRTTLGENDQVERAGKKLVVPFRMMLILVVTLVIYETPYNHTMYIIVNYIIILGTYTPGRVSKARQQWSSSCRRRPRADGSAPRSRSVFRSVRLRYVIHVGLPVDTRARPAGRLTVRSLLG